MKFKDLLRSNWLSRTILVVWIITAILVISMLTNLDRLVNSTLYDFGLQFSYEWANPYWMYLRLSYAFLCVSTALGLSGIALGFYKSKVIIDETIAVAEKFVNQKSGVQVKLADRKPIVKSKVKNIDGTDMVISCPNCSKVFGRPMAMLNFEDGKTRLINVCPHCNYELGKIEDYRKSNPEFHIKDQESIESDPRIKDLNFKNKK